MHMKKVIYTCLFGEYEELRPISFKAKGWDYICFTDSLDKSTVKGWDFISVREVDCDATRLSRYPKIMPHIFFKKYDYSVYIDANIDVLDPLLYLKVNLAIENDVLMAGIKNPKRDSIFEEADYCLKRGKDFKNDIFEQIEMYNEKGFKGENGLLDNNILFRKHNELIDLHELWWRHVKNYSRLDQISLMYCLWKMSLPTYYLFEEGFDISKSTSFQVRSHPVPFTVQPVVFFFRKMLHQLKRPFVSNRRR